MKTLLYAVLVAISIFGIYAADCNSYQITNNDLFIQAVDSHVTPDQLVESARIITGRLHDYCDGVFDVNLVPEKNQIHVSYTNDCNQQYIKDLLVQKGSLGLYETYNRKELVKLMADNTNVLQAILSVCDTTGLSAIGCVSIDKVVMINKSIASLNTDNKCKMSWSQRSDNSIVCLYALKTNCNGSALLTSANIDSVAYDYNEMSDIYYIKINFDKSSIALWRDATERNLNRTIAIVLDDTVISAPIVKSVIKGGKSEITGNYRESEARYIAAMIGNGELPVNFEIVQ